MTNLPADVKFLYPGNRDYFNRTIDKPVNEAEIKANIRAHLQKILPPVPMLIFILLFCGLIGVASVFAGISLVLPGTRALFSSAAIINIGLNIAQIGLGLIIVAIGCVFLYLACMFPVLKLSSGSLLYLRLIRRPCFSTATVNAIGVEDGKRLLYVTVKHDDVEKAYQFATLSNVRLEISDKIQCVSHRYVCVLL